MRLPIRSNTLLFGEEVVRRLSPRIFSSSCAKLENIWLVLLSSLVSLGLTDSGIFKSGVLRGTLYLESGAVSFSVFLAESGLSLEIAPVLVGRFSTVSFCLELGEGINFFLASSSLRLSKALPPDELLAGELAVKSAEPKVNLDEEGVS